MDLSGNLKVFEPIFVLQILNLAMSTGKLKLEIDNNSASIYFDQGRLTFAEIADRPIRLGEYLVKEKYITRKQLDKALKKKIEGKRLGRILIENKILNEANLSKAIEEQIKEVVYEVVKWRDGNFNFSSGGKPHAQDVFIDIPLDHLMLEGLKRLDEADEKK